MYSIETCFEISSLSTVSSFSIFLSTNSNLKVGVVFNSTNAMFFPSSASTFSSIYLSISFCASTYPITSPSIATSYFGVYFINTTAVIAMNATDAIFITFNNSFV